MLYHTQYTYGKLYHTGIELVKYVRYRDSLYREAQKDWSKVNAYNPKYSRCRNMKQKPKKKIYSQVSFRIRDTSSILYIPSL